MIPGSPASPAAFEFGLPEFLATSLAVVIVLYFVLPKWLQQRKESSSSVLEADAFNGSQPSAQQDPPT